MFLSELRYWLYWRPVFEITLAYHTIRKFFGKKYS